MSKSLDFQKFEIRRLNENSIVKSFDCGDADINEFVLKESSLYRKSLLAVSYVLVDKDTPTDVIGFFSMANDKVALGDFESKTEFNRFRKQQGFPQPKRLRSYPAIKLCRLGVSNAYKGENVGTFLLDFVKTYFTSDNKSGCRFLTVDAYINAVPFYEKNGFCMLGSGRDDNPYTRLMFYDLNEIVA
ncbi:MAG: GNAT family N-acetyltransferase [Fibrobacter sp.]|nr:GNAT family N-acetyltransferase [Fibrobacter sp.]